MKTAEDLVATRLENWKATLCGDSPRPTPPPETPEQTAARELKAKQDSRDHNDELLIKGGFTKRAVEAVKHAQGASIDRARQLLPRALKDGLVVLLGPTGRGKTVMATWLAMQRQENGMKCGKFMTARAMFSEVKSTFGGHLKRARFNGGEQVITEDWLLESWSFTPFLVIDEVQTRTESVWEDGMLEEVINARYGEMLPTVLIANLSLDDAQKALGPRIMDRANECGGVVVCDWETYRI